MDIGLYDPSTTILSKVFHIFPYIQYIDKGVIDLRCLISAKSRRQQSAC